jgi:hypothetical protein
MNKRIITIVLSIILLLVILLINLGRIISFCYGMSQHSYNLMPNQINESAKYYNIEDNSLFYVDSSFSNYLIEKNTESITHFQKALQLIYFDKTGKPVAHYLNCYTKGFPNYKWNNNKNLHSFPPEPQKYNEDKVCIPDTSVRLGDIIKNIIPLNRKTSSNNIQDDSTEYYIAVFWSKSSGRQTKVMLDALKDNLKLAKSKFKIIYINNDKLLWQKYH